MATFKVDQRVRIVSMFPNTTVPLVGMEGSIISTHNEFRLDGWLVVLDAFPNTLRKDRACFFISSQLAPLTDPSADQFIERIKKLEREPIFLCPAQRTVKVTK